MKKSSFILLFCLTISGVIQGQSLIKYFKSFNTPKGWTSELKIETHFHAYFEKDQIASLSFRNGERLIEFMVFDQEAIKDSISQNKINIYLEKPYCQAFSTEVFGLSLFIIEKYFFIPKNCPDCNFEHDKQCKKIAKRIFKWHYKINRPPASSYDCCRF